MHYNHLLFLFLYFCKISTSVSVTPSATLYSSGACTGNLVSFPRGTYEPYLSAYGVDDQAYSVFLTGPWLFYELENFNEGIAPMDYIFEPYGACVPLQTLAGHVSSLRSVGDIDDFTIPSLTLYATRDFQGEQEYVPYDTGHVYTFGNQRSLIITGEEAWTIYDQPSFAGNALCLIPQFSDVLAPSLIPNFATFDPPIAIGSIASVRRGCYGRIPRAYIRNPFVNNNKPL